MSGDCPHCGQPLTGRATDASILAGIKASRGYIYAAGTPDGGADRTRWYVTQGQPKGPFSLAQVRRVIELGGLVPYVPDMDEAYTTTELFAEMEAKIAARGRRRAPRLASPGAGDRVG